jgi:hypothetical protein
LSEIFVRSKATISERVNQTESDWKELQRKIAEAEEIEKLAKQQLIEEEKQRLRLEQENKQKNEKSE